MASKERGLICTGEIVRAFLDDRKTQTRRVVKLPEQWHRGRGAFENNPHGDEEFIIYGDCGTKTMYCPHGRVGDRLYVKEGFQIEQYSFRRNCVGGKYLADNKEFWTEVYQREYDLIKNRKFPLRATSGRFMYKSLARIWREIAGVRVEQVQDITWRDCKAEGITLVGDELVFNNQKQKQSLMKTKFERLWNSINTKRGFGWETNPWIWVLDLQIQDKPERR